MEPQFYKHWLTIFLIIDQHSMSQQNYCKLYGVESWFNDTQFTDIRMETYSDPRCTSTFGKRLMNQTMNATTHEHVTVLPFYSCSVGQKIVMIAFCKKHKLSNSFYTKEDLQLSIATIFVNFHWNTGASCLKAN